MKLVAALRSFVLRVFSRHAWYNNGRTRVTKNRKLVAVCLTIVTISNFALTPVAAAQTTVDELEIRSSKADQLPRFTGPAGAMQRQGSTMMAPEGTNDVNCKANEIVIFAHGTNSSFFRNFDTVSRELVHDGWCVYGIDYGFGNGSNGWIPMEQSVEQLEQLVQAAMKTSGASKVHLVGYSQGATITRYWVNRRSNGRAASWFGLGSPSSGVWAPAVGPVESIQQDLVAPALLEHRKDSRFMQELNNPMTIPGVRYATFGSRTDGVLAGVQQSIPGATNVVLQDRCPQDLSGHFFLPHNPTAISAIRQWLNTGVIGQLPCQARPLGYSVLETAVVTHAGRQPTPPPVVYPPVTPAVASENQL